MLLKRSYFVIVAAIFNLSGVISLLIPCCMVKKGTKKDAFYSEESDWRSVAAASLYAAHHGRGAGAGMV
ncbi:hypothetical protein EVY06_18815 [Citrobacter koseri]|uniref:Uncharacterized protein n=2 Tax=Citrobacter koseri TaxID=545 RepID=A8AIF9_CITK8|nr:hypothetical protein CKO_02148 [Citrobacter koseri ATCC BAA-895]ASE85138.1 hypothetical protein CEP66_22915 [Citrobacter koseri]QCQ71947.1 hypothetical protein FD428_13425 [Citrobacter sp. TBCP-5362]ATF96944.1 hypothetical protein CO700_07735 [Citrobacter koseri]AVE60152.1 hypothetical protein AM352_18140 [Citrobacter koseri]